MSKKTREEKRAEERRIIAEMELAIKEKEEAEKSAEETTETTEEGKEEKVEKKDKKQVYHCPRCRTELKDDGHCPTCNYKIYVPMDEKKRGKIKLILTAVFMVIFVVLFVCLQFKK